MEVGGLTLCEVRVGGDVVRGGRALRPAGRELVRGHGWERRAGPETLLVGFAANFMSVFTVRQGVHSFPFLEDFKLLGLELTPTFRGSVTVHARLCRVLRGRWRGGDYAWLLGRLLGRYAASACSRLAGRLTGRALRGLPGRLLGSAVGSIVLTVGTSEGSTVGVCEGASVVGTVVGCSVGSSEGAPEGARVGSMVGCSVGSSVAQ